ncbi:hypothetical protein PVK62_08985 [Aliivibrio sp. S3MY1]|uniref:hypothetical protein n=1 Tax=unclassified Aliivibrio TaxID=2645654 RepID=UPI002378034E|nr:MULTISPECIES: hypothetical protein [unclassified Aliivibrio]MDD9195965.1 hypothetical protein [Aliivibrio sp. S3MY1]MDD9199359.1 hypothetical protein [Aliivibrio sp. S2MY1]
MKTNITLVFFLATLFGCSDDTQGPAKEELFPQKIEVVIDRKNKYAFDINTTLRPLDQLNATISNISKNKIDTVFRFNDVNFEKEPSGYKIINQTPTDTDRLTVSYKNKVAMLILDQVLPSFSTADIMLPDEMNGTADILSVYQMKIGALDIHIGSEEPDDSSAYTCPELPAKCVRPAFKNEQIVMTTMAVNLHNIMNRRDFIDDYKTMMAEKCFTVKEFVECKSYDATNKMPYVDMALTRYSHSGHVVTWSVFSQQYNAEAWGSGYKSNINNLHSNTFGKIQLKDRYVNDESPYFEDYSMQPQRYNDAAHELGHATAFSHSSGMSYGFGDLVRSYLEEHTTQEWRTQRRTMIIPKIMLDVTYNGDMSAKVKVYAIDKTVNYNNISFEILSHKPLNYKLNYVSGADEILLQFDDSFPENDTLTDNNVDKDMGTVVYIRAYNKDDPEATVSTIAFNKKMLREKESNVESIVLNNQYSYIIPSVENGDYLIGDDGWWIRRRCFDMSGTLATEPQQKIVWDKLVRTEEIFNSNFLDSEFVSINELIGPDGYTHQAVSIFSYPDYSKTTKDIIYPIGDTRKFMCQVPTSQL